MFHGGSQRAGSHNLCRSGNLLLNLLCCCADGVDALHALAKQRSQQSVVAAFVLASQDQVDACGKRLQRFDGGIHVGGLGVVVIIHAPG